MMVHRPSWFRDGEVFVSYADTVGINKDGNLLFRVNPDTGTRTAEIDDKVADDVDSLLQGSVSPTGRWVRSAEFPVAVPVYYDDASLKPLHELLKRPEMIGVRSRTIGSLIESGDLIARAGHGSPSADMRDGGIPYIKVSDIRAGQVNINPTNLVSRVVAERFWRGATSSVQPFDLVTPMRASKNIGEFAMIMPGQQDAVFTKEVLILRASSNAPADNFYLMWALALKAVHAQWKRVVFMQTNREDVGKRYLEIELPWPNSKASADALSESFRQYYLGMERLRRSFMTTLEQSSDHHVYLGASETADGAPSS